MARKKNRRRHTTFLANPTEGAATMFDLAKRIAVSAAIVGGVAIAGKFGVDKLLSYYTNADGTPKLTGYTEGAAKAGLGIAAGVAIALMPKIPAAIGAGLSLGCVIAGGEDAISTYQANAAAASSTATPAASSTATSATSTTSTASAGTPAATANQGGAGTSTGTSATATAPSAGALGRGHVGAFGGSRQRQNSFA